MTQNTINTKYIDRRADLASVLFHPVRREIRDVLRNNEPLTLTEISRKLNKSEPLVYHHLMEMVKSGLLVKRESRISNRRVTLYCLSDEYNELFSEKRYDISPIIGISIVYGLLLISSLILPKYIIRIYSIFGLNTIKSIVSANLIGLFTSLMILVLLYVQNNEVIIYDIEDKLILKLKKVVSMKKNIVLLIDKLLTKLHILENKQK